MAALMTVVRILLYVPVALLWALWRRFVVGVVFAVLIAPAYLSYQAVLLVAGPRAYSPAMTVGVACELLAIGACIVYYRKGTQS